MSSDAPPPAATADSLRALRDAGIMSPPAFHRALELLLGPPSPDAWRRFVSRALLVLGVALVLGGVVHFTAYNWHLFPKVAKFALLEAAIAGAALSALALRGLTRKMVLLLAAGLVGPLLAAYGQVYQTGADPWTLFAWWALLVVPWAVTARFAPLWALVVVLLNVSFHLFWIQVNPSDALEIDGSSLIGGFLLNGVAWLSIELAASRFAWARPRWPARLAAIAALVPMLPLVSDWLITSKGAIWRSAATGPFALLCVSGALVVLVAVYRRRRPDLFMLTLAALTGTTLATSLCSRVVHTLLPNFSRGCLVLASLLVAQVATAVSLLKRNRGAWAAAS
jgi:uncharacterized membrane protein